MQINDYLENGWISLVHQLMGLIYYLLRQSAPNGGDYRIQ